MRKPLLALSLILSTGIGVTQVADAMAATPAGSTLSSSPPSSSTASPSNASSRAVSGAAIVRTALRYLGYPYAATGNSPSTGFSCIGFVSYVYRQNGIALPGDLGTALAYAPRVSFNNLLPGDILYFQNTVWTGLSHAAIYIGGGKFVHAEWYGKGVRITSFYNDRSDGNYWPAKYLTANRPWTGAAVGAVVPSNPGTVPSPPGTVKKTVVPQGPAALVSAQHGVNLRSNPSRSSTSIEVLGDGTTVYILGRSHGWVKVQLPDGTVGWVVASAITTGSATTTPTAPNSIAHPQTNSRKVSATVTGLRVHASPSTAAQVVGTVSRGEKLTYLGYSNGWYKVRLPNGTVGWVSGAYIKGGSSSRTTTRRSTSSGVSGGSRAKGAYNVRSGPSLNYSVISVIPVGGSYTIIGYRSGWYKVRLPNGATGWVSATLIGGSSTTKYSSYGSGSTSRKSGSTSSYRGARLTAGVRMHSGPGVAAPVIGLAAAGTHVKVLGYSAGWVKVRLPNGRSGWVSGVYVR